ncbi:ribosome maturation factor RimP [Actinomadura spongiicola]|uniref:Ribosome maturation factor RimP n=1 Tax=Actinomadura spongiicola TaxID=2303421 RepID=A0A372GJX6_9ACTN|nr:ribosome maturation factor RimP [Actinomadura spongiicola]RFS85670.1 ribosome maturation factor RimP [Actinomadura spongiicola]
MSVESRGGRAQGGRGQGGHGDVPSRPARQARSATVAELTRLLAPAVDEAGFDLEEVDVKPAGRRRLVRVVVDGDDGVNLDDIATISETASELLDTTDVMGTSPYVLEVTSPGVDRPLTEPRHWRRAVGRLVVVPLTEGGQVEGRVVAADDESVEIDVVQKRRGRGAGGGGGGSAGSKAAGSRPASKGASKGGSKGAATETVRRRFGLGELGRGRVQVEFKPAPSERGAEDTRSPAEPD